MHTSDTAAGCLTDAPNPPRLLRRPEVKHRTGLSTSTLYELMARNQFPRPIQLTTRTVAWSESSVDSWIRARIAASRNAA
ncbi:MAG: AlpA family transcriptional regulator [Gammaproteobacteria bacterium]